jgi:hypothetical protein
MFTNFSHKHLFNFLIRMSRFHFHRARPPIAAQEPQKAGIEPNGEIPRTATVTYRTGSGHCSPASLIAMAIGAPGSSKRYFFILCSIVAWNPHIFALYAMNSLGEKSAPTLLQAELGY